jgi:hypothetical protein
MMLTWMRIYISMYDTGVFCMGLRTPYVLLYKADADRIKDELVKGTLVQVNEWMLYMYIRIYA